MTSEEIIDALLSASSGAIAATNLIQGLRIGQFNDHEMKEILTVWAELIRDRGFSGSNVGGALALLRADYSTLLAKFPHLPDSHIRDRRRDTTKNRKHRRVAVRDCWYIPTWAETTAFEDDGIDFRSGPGSAGYKKLKEMADTSRSIRVKPNVTLTNPRAGERAVLFVTLAEPLWSELLAKDFDLRADFARDELGLVHMESDAPQIVLFFEADQIEVRDDRGRPTVIDSGGNPRFVCLFRSPKHNVRCWGATANLAAVAPNLVLPGRPERVCGSFPPPTLRDGLDLEFGFIGAPIIPRGDGLGSGDDVFAAAFESYALTGDLPLREALGAVLNGGKP
jgi:hypothetical protein